MKPTMMRVGTASLVLMLCALFVLLAGCWTCRPRYIGFGGSQPGLKISVLPGGAGEKNVADVIRRAKAFWPPPEDYWPEPVSVTEREMFWWVQFEIKPKVFRSFWGREEMQMVIPGGTCIQVEKADFSCRRVPNR